MSGNCFRYKKRNYGQSIICELNEANNSKMNILQENITLNDSFFFTAAVREFAEEPHCYFI